jgi:hypothetical protein
MSTQPGVGYTFTNSSLGGNLSIIEPWMPMTPVVVEPVNTHPFKVTYLGVKTTGGVDTYFFTVQPGLINNLKPMIDGTTWFMDHMPKSDYEMVYYQFQFNPTTGYAYIVLKLGYDSSTPGVYPDSNIGHVSASPSYPVVGCLTYMPSTGDVDSYIVLATAYQNPVSKAITIWQQVTSSLWADRLKIASLDAKYYFARI